MDRLRGLGSGVGFTVSAGSGVHIDGWVGRVTGGEVIGDGGGVPISMSDPAVVVGEV